MQDVIVTGILLLIVVLACLHIWKDKKKGRKCHGCTSGNCESCAGRGYYEKGNRDGKS